MASVVYTNSAVDNPVYMGTYMVEHPEEPHFDPREMSSSEDDGRYERLSRNINGNAHFISEKEGSPLYSTIQKQ